MFKEKSIESILSRANQVVLDLREVSDINFVRADNIKQEIVHMQDKMDEHVHVANRAAELAARWAKLVE